MKGRHSLDARVLVIFGELQFDAGLLESSGTRDGTKSAPGAASKPAEGLPCPEGRFDILAELFRIGETERKDRASIIKKDPRLCARPLGLAAGL
jgi:hypothetical protein